jgi:hypothetical protein
MDVSGQADAMNRSCTVVGELRWRGKKAAGDAEVRRRWRMAAGQPRSRASWERGHGGGSAELEFGGKWGLGNGISREP